MQVVRVARAGFPVRLGLREFVERYALLGGGVVEVASRRASHEEKLDQERSICKALIIAIQVGGCLFCKRYVVVGGVTYSEAFWTFDRIDVDVLMLRFTHECITSENRMVCSYHAAIVSASARPLTMHPRGKEMDKGWLLAVKYLHTKGVNIA